MCIALYVECVIQRCVCACVCKYICRECEIERGACVYSVICRVCDTKVRVCMRVYHIYAESVRYRERNVCESVCEAVCVSNIGSLLFSM